ncbi:hypothetical protein SAMN06265222_101324 [Neorhodopirellula lusitana]|uniref:Uncharacterized protein n=1 Tax=Neorhodopirellula lusitana TaxID=445327 RepID=A0ABY1PQI3_9BACT|nr:hypothetical protein SAMN06265222_101324 [Neorhodopirellula lusitana]
MLTGDSRQSSEPIEHILVGIGSGGDTVTQVRDSIRFRQANAPR